MEGSGRTLLEQMESPDQLRGLRMSELDQLAEEIRQCIITTVTETGGHLASSLGVVELTLALHRVFDSPHDRIIWDVGHQSYAHKLVTGRLKEFSTLRQRDGLSGFPKPQESPHDPFAAGHSSTSVAAGLGFAVAEKLRHEDREVVAVIGDGALTAGMAYEGLNTAGHLAPDLVVVLNDNSMSIAPNVGAMSNYLTRLRSEPTYQRVKEDLNVILQNIPRVGRRMAESLERVKGSFKYLFIPGIIFEELGFTYLGPVNGHNIETLSRVLQKARDLTGPVLVHAVTVKGKGYQPAETEPSEFHGVSGNSTASFSPPDGAMKYSEVFSRTMVRLAADDDRVVGITAAMPDGTGLSRLAEQIPQQYFDVGIAEQTAVTFAGGLAAAGFRPVVAIYSTFLQRAYDQVIHDIALQDLPVVFAVDRAGIVGKDGETHQGAFDLAFLRHIPNMTVMAPRNENQLAHMLATAVAYDDGPVAVRYPRGYGWGEALPEHPRHLTIGKGELLADGNDVAIVGIGHVVTAAVQAADILAREGLSVGVADARFVKPLDCHLLRRMAAKVKLLVTVEEGSAQGGFGSAVLEMLTSDMAPSTLPRIHLHGLPDEFIPHGDQQGMRIEYGLDAVSIADKVRGLLNGAQ